MAHISTSSIGPVVRALGNRVKEFDSNIFMLKSAVIAARGNATLEGTAGENLAGWELGVFQFAFSETNYATYRGRTAAEGSAIIQCGHQIVCRDTVASTGSAMWYSPSTVVRPPAAMPSPPRVELHTLFADEPAMPVLKTVRSRTGASLCLHHAECTFHFCTILVAKKPSAEFVPLKHFYWNFRMEAHFDRDSAGMPHLARLDHSNVNIQGSVHSGLPSDSRFARHFLNRHLPTANSISRRIGSRQFAHPRFVTGWI
jgi:hypothetical protein